MGLPAGIIQQSRRDSQDLEQFFISHQMIGATLQITSCGLDFTRELPTAGDTERQFALSLSSCAGVPSSPPTGSAGPPGPRPGSTP